MKARGYSSNLVSLCENLDGNLHGLLADLEQYLYESEELSPVASDLLTSNLSSVFDKFGDRGVIQEDLQRVSALMISELIGFVLKLIIIVSRNRIEC